jgi:rSAM/selenodomain-associated transferase 2
MTGAIHSTVMRDPVLRAWRLMIPKSLMRNSAGHGVSTVYHVCCNARRATGRRILFPACDACAPRARMISVIIPALNEARALPVTLRHLLAQPGEFEVILVDGGSDDETVSLARAWDQVKVLSSDPGRAAQMNSGAAAANGDLLLFLHADTMLPDGAVAQLNGLEADATVEWGGFHQQFSGNTWALRMISRLHNWRCSLTGIFYGDQGMFVRSRLFNKVGGFPSELVMEDVIFSETLLQRAKPVFLPARVVTDSRKFEQMGPLRSFSRCLLILVCYQLRLPIRGRGFFAAIR